jgi:hypothetical protein
MLTKHSKNIAHKNIPSEASMRVAFTCDVMAASCPPAIEAATHQIQGKFMLPSDPSSFSSYHGAISRRKQASFS